MKRLQVILVFLTFGIIYYLYWQNRIDSEKPNLSLKNSRKIETISNEKSRIPTSSQKSIPIIPSKKLVKDKKIMGDFSPEKNDFFQKVKDTFKDNEKEWENCEDEFDENFGELMAMDRNQRIVYLSDPHNLEVFIEKIFSSNITIPSSSKIVKLMAEPIASDIDRKKILETFGSVKICRGQGKLDLMDILLNLKNKNRTTALATIVFFENEISANPDPDILPLWGRAITVLLENHGIDRFTSYPELTQIEKDVSDSGIGLNIGNTLPPEDARTKREFYEYAIKTQSKFKILLKKIKEKFI